MQNLLLEHAYLNAGKSNRVNQEFVKRVNPSSTESLKVSIGAFVKMPTNHIWGLHDSAKQLCLMRGLYREDHLTRQPPLTFAEVVIGCRDLI